MSENILIHNNETRRILLPIPKENEVFWSMYEQHRDLDWRVSEIDLAPDLKDWEKLNKDEKHFIIQVLSFFSASDGIVNESVTSRLFTEVGLPEIRAFYAFQAHIETIHAHMYAQLIDVYTRNYDKEERNKIFNALDYFPGIAKKGLFAIEVIENPNCSFAERVMYQLIVEGIFFSASFCAIYWLKKSGLMPGLCQSNELIARDEGIHCEFGVAVYHALESKLEESQVHKMFDEAVTIEKEFVHESLPVKLIGMDAEQMSNYVEFVADYWLTALGYRKLYHKENPFPWMELISMEGKTNFFEKRVTEYTRPGKTEGREFSTNEDF